MIEIKDLSVVYDNEIVALNHIDLKLDKKCHVIVGQNGSGKSTLLQTLVGICEKQGDIIVNDMILNDENLKEIRNQVGLVFQNPDHQLFMSSIYEDLTFGLINLNLSHEEIEKRISEISQYLEIENILNRSAHRLSGGQKRMAAIGTILVMNPDIILMDEPSSFLDPKARRKVIHFIQNLSKTTIIATHDLDMALDIGDEVIILNNGEVKGIGKPEDILLNKELLEENGLELPYRYQR